MAFNWMNDNEGLYGVNSATGSSYGRDLTTGWAPDETKSTDERGNPPADGEFYEWNDETQSWQHVDYEDLTDEEREALDNYDMYQKHDHSDDPPKETVNIEQAAQPDPAQPDEYDKAYDNASKNAITSAANANEEESKRVVLDGSITAYDPLSYDSLLVNYRAFRQAGGLNSSPFNTWDFLGHNFFRILFHFTDSIRNENGTGIGTGAGLLHPSWIGLTLPTRSQMINGVNELIYWNNSSAWSYLMQNAEYIRANLLKQFIELLSNINTESPWYFQSIKGIETALIRKQVTENFEFKDRGKITIECLDDSVDQRIGTLLDLYRAAVWSWQTKRAVIPANLRKFDMTVVILSSPIRNLHTPAGGKVPNPIGESIGATSPTTSNLSTDYASASASSGPNTHRASYKMIELHNCEIDYNSSGSGYDNLDNKEGFGHKYNIDIYYDDAVEVRYNEFLENLNEISDLIGTDIIEPIYTENTTNNIQPSTIDSTDAGSEESQEVNEQSTQTQDPISETTPPSTKNTTDDRVGSGSSKFSGALKSAAGGILDKASEKLNEKLNDTMTSLKDRVQSEIDELETYGASWVNSQMNKVLTGNISGLSISDVEQQVEQAMDNRKFTILNNLNGNSVTSISPEETKQNTYNGKGVISQPYSNIFKDTPPNVSDIINLGNIFRGKTLAQS